MMKAAGQPRLWRGASASLSDCRRMIQLRTRVKPTAVPSLDDMIALWQRLLNVAAVGPDDDFFDLGGDSLQALTLFHEIERTTGRSLPITAIYEASTPARLMTALSEEAPARFSPLVRLKSGVGEPLFIVHGIGGNVLELFKLGQSLDTPRPVYAIQARGVDGSEEPHDNVGDMVDYYVAHLRSVQPRGPYFLAGYSFGGIIAIDMARRFQAKGDKVPLVALIDSYAHPATFPKKLRQFVRVGVSINQFRTKPFGEALRANWNKLKNRSGVALPTPMIMADFPEDGTGTALRNVHVAAFKALCDYQPRHYLGPVEFFKPTTSIFPIAPKRVWGDLIEGGLAVHDVPGDHGSMVRSEVAGLAHAMSLALHRAGEMAKHG